MRDYLFFHALARDFLEALVFLLALGFVILLAALAPVESVLLVLDFLDFALEAPFAGPLLLILSVFAATSARLSLVTLRLLLKALTSSVLLALLFTETLAESAKDKRSDLVRVFKSSILVVDAIGFHLNYILCPHSVFKDLYITK